jgi:hypothetical protein
VPLIEGVGALGGGEDGVGVGPVALDDVDAAADGSIEAADVAEKQRGADARPQEQPDHVGPDAAGGGRDDDLHLFYL